VVTETPATVDGVVPNRVVPIRGRLFHVRVAGVKVEVGYTVNPPALVIFGTSVRLAPVMVAPAGTGDGKAR
jgi:hypothetical protein